jgi:hypothetical protein
LLVPLLPAVRARERKSKRAEEESRHKRARLLLFANGLQSFSGAERSEHRNLSQEIQVSFKKKPSDKRGFSRSLSVEENRDRFFRKRNKEEASSVCC